MSKQLSSIEAFEIVSESLQGLPTADKARVLKAVAALHGLEPIAVRAHTAPPPPTKPKAVAPEPRRGRGPNRKKCEQCAVRPRHSNHGRCRLCGVCKELNIQRRNERYLADRRAAMASLANGKDHSSEPVQ